MEAGFLITRIVGIKILSIIYVQVPTARQSSALYLSARIPREISYLKKISNKVKK